MRVVDGLMLKEESVGFHKLVKDARLALQPQTDTKVSVTGNVETEVRTIHWIKQGGKSPNWNLTTLIFILEINSSVDDVTTYLNIYLDDATTPAVSVDNSDYATATTPYATQQKTIIGEMNIEAENAGRHVLHIKMYTDSPTETGYNDYFYLWQGR